MKKSKEEYDRLIEISPFIPKKVLDMFNSKFKNTDDLIKPEIGDIINSTSIYLMDEAERQKMINEINRDVIVSNNILEQKEKNKSVRIKQFRESFFQLNNRYPTDKELEAKNKYIEELDDSLNNSAPPNVSDDEDDDNDAINSDDIETGNLNNDTDSRTSVV